MDSRGTAARTWASGGGLHDGDEDSDDEEASWGRGAIELNSGAPAMADKQRGVERNWRRREGGMGLGFRGGERGQVKKGRDGATWSRGVHALAVHAMCVMPPCFHREEEDAVKKKKGEEVKTVRAQVGLG